MFYVAKLQPGERQSPPTPGKGHRSAGQDLPDATGTFPSQGSSPCSAPSPSFSHGVSLLCTKPLFFPWSSPALHQVPLFSMEFPCSAPNPSLFHGVSLQDEAQLIFKPNASNLDHTKSADKPLWQRKPSIPLSLFGSQSCQSAKQAPLTAGNQSKTKQGCRVSASLGISASLRISTPLENPLAARPASRSEALALLPQFSLTLPWC